MKYYQKRKTKRKIEDFAKRLTKNILVFVAILFILNSIIELEKGIDIYKLIPAKNISFDLTAEAKEQPQDFTNVVPVKPIDIDEVVDKVYILESSGGKNDLCLSRGGVNGFGYRFNKSEEKCYNSYAEVRGEVMKWFKKQLENKTLGEALCYYNQGIKTENCNYYTNFLKLN